MQMSHAILEITKIKHQKQVNNVLKMHLRMISRSLRISGSLFKSDSFLSFPQYMTPSILVAM